MRTTLTLDCYNPKHPYTTTFVVKTFFDNIYKLHGLPMIIVTDRDKVFTSKFWRELFTLPRISLGMSSVYYPRSDGQTDELTHVWRSTQGVIEKVEKVAYKLELSPGSKIHPVFHVSLLKKKIGSKYFPSLGLPELEDEIFKVYPAAILARRLIPRNNVGVP
ncbi:UNVERIFIED_CONTAM: hypothetical protein Sradi_1718800 [Sesamum radiatum]|uniref:Tf2-1-like SH3-like domain-containing protein n=1 Tax=Sesamum radiatum TaxID=300843 RepID=A0AAW2TT43_SESRA